MNTSLRSCVLAALLAASPAALAAEPEAAGREPPAPWKHVDLGLARNAAPAAPAAASRPTAGATVAGSAAEAGGVLKVNGTMDLWGTADGCHLVYQPVDGDAELVARVTGMDNPGGVAHAKAGLTVRASLEAGAPHVTLAVTATDGTQLLHRDALGAKTVKAPVDAEAQKGLLPKATFPIWLKLARAGDEFTAYESADGTAWRKSGSITVKLPAAAVTGVAVSSHRPDVLTTGTFDRVSMTRVADGSRRRPRRKANSAAARRRRRS